MAFRKESPQRPKPTVREMVEKYGDKWYLFCATHPISSAVFSGDMMTYGDRHEATIMSLCEKGQRDRVDDWDAMDRHELPPVQVDFVYPPIPERCCDYAAYRDPEGKVGRGATPFIAINDLIEQESE